MFRTSLLRLSPVIKLRLVSALACSLLLLACAGGRNSAEDGEVSPSNEFVEISEAERLLGDRLVLPGYVPERLRLEAEVSVVFSDSEAIAATLFYFPEAGAAQQPAQRQIDSLTLTQWKVSRAPTETNLPETAQVRDVEVALGSRQVGQGRLAAFVRWEWRDKTFQLDLMGAAGASGSVLRDEALLIVESLVQP